MYFFCRLFVLIKRNLQIINNLSIIYSDLLYYIVCDDYIRILIC